MTSLLKIGLILAAVTIILALVQPAEADDEVKRKRVIIKVPHRVKHIYHHHTKKVHVYKKKPKPKPKKKKPHKHVVIVEEEEIVQPSKTWKVFQQAYKGGHGWDDWKASPSSYKHSVKHPDDFGGSGEHYEEDFSFEDDHDSRESRYHNRGTFHRGNTSSRGKSGKGRKKGSRTHSYQSYEEPSREASVEIHHHLDSEYEPDYDRPRRKPKSKSTSSNRGYSSSKRQLKKTTSRPRFEDKLQPEDYDELYDRGPAYPERKEHPSWHERSRESIEPSETITASHSQKSQWSLPRVPEVKEFIDDAKDNPDPAYVYPNSGGFVPSSTYNNPITTITASVVQNSPILPPPPPPPPYNPPPPVPGQSSHQPSHHQHTNPPKFRNQKPQKNPGYLSQVSHTPEGLTVKYQSHIGHSSDVKSPSSSFQSVSYGNLQGKK